MKLSTTLGVSALSALALAASSSSSSSTPEIVIKGNKFFYSNNGTQFFIKGVAYQKQPSDKTTFSDPLADGDACKRDLPYLQKLDTNVLRVYAINSSMSHDTCMNLFAENGIYVVADLSEPGLSISRDSPSWTVSLLNRYTDVVDIMAQYSNTLGFFAGNEVTNNNTNTDASPFVKAAIRDTKAYIAKKKYRSIPVGYSTNDDEDTRDYLADYFSCGDSDESADFYGINMYEWCGNKVNYASSGYKDRTAEFANFTIPVFFSEYGCNVPQPRVFADVSTLFGSEMSQTWSGGIVYMYFEESNNYGLVTIKDDAVSTLNDYSYLSVAIHSVSPSGVNSNSWKPSNTATRACPASTLSNWKAATALPPTPNDGICQCMYDSLSCIVASKVDVKDYETLFDYVCSEVSCDGINANGTSGTYGSYSFCSPAEKLSFVLNLYYEKVGNNAGCSFSGSATLAGSHTTAATCSSVLSQAGTAGTGDITASVTGSSNKVADSSASGSGSGSTASASASSGAATPGAVPPFSGLGVKAGLALLGSFALGTLLLV